MTRVACQFPHFAMDDGVKVLNSSPNRPELSENDG